MLAERRAADAVAPAQETDFLMMRGDALSDQAEVRWLIGRPADAADDLERAAGLYELKGMRPAADTARRAREELLVATQGPVVRPDMRPS